ncbi:MAG: RHS repeat-associated core domain-containing protein [Candidatus Omnitrophota bacterium]
MKKKIYKIFPILLLAFLAASFCPKFLVFAEENIEPAPEPEAVVQQAQESEPAEIVPTEQPEQVKEPEKLPNPALMSPGHGNNNTSGTQSNFNLNALENFQPSPFTGAATYSVPIVVPPGRRGIQPNVALFYSSQAGNDIVGMGWGIDLGSIERSTKNGAPKYDSSDTFLFKSSGSTQELTSIGNNEYRAKIESSFMKFEFKTTYWLVTDKAGTKYYFGSSENSRQQKDLNEIFSWRLDKVIDTCSNYMLLTYQHDKNQVYPDTITYTGNEAAGDLPAYTVTFSIEDRPDVRINHRSGINVITAKRINEIKVDYGQHRIRRYELKYSDSTTALNKPSLLKAVSLSGTPNPDTAEAEYFPEIKFDYEQLDAEFEPPASWEGVSYTNTNDWQMMSIRFTDDNATTLDIFDINGDGLPDRIKASEANESDKDFTRWKVQLNNGSGFDQPIDWGGVTCSDINDYTRMAIRCINQDATVLDTFDINCDGLPDRIRTGEYFEHGRDYTKWKVQLNNGSGFDPPIDWEGVSYTNTNDWQRMSIRFINNKATVLDTVDMNGDGLPDRIKAGESIELDKDYTKWKVQLNNNPILPTLLTSIDNGIGGTIEVTYKPYKGADNSDYNTDKPLPFPIWVVNTFTHTAAFNTESVTTRHDYDSGFFDFIEREFCGFGLVKVSDSQGNYGKSLFLQDPIFKGKLYEQQTLDSSGNFYSKATNAWEAEELCPGVNFPYVSETNNYIYDGSSSDEENYQKIIKSTTQYTFKDSLIDKIEVINYGDISAQGDEKTSVTELAHNTSFWLLMLPCHSYSLDADNKIVSEKWLYYDNNANWQDTPSRGFLTKDEAWINPPLPSGKDRIAASYEYDNYGNLTLTTDPLGRSIKTDYETVLNQYPAKITNSLGHEVKYTYDYSFGQIKTSTDPNSQTTTSKYDSLGRLIQIIGPLDTENDPAVKYQYNIFTKPISIIKQTKANLGEYLTTYTFYDGAGRLLQTRSPAERDPVKGSMQAVSGPVVFDERGLAKEQYFPKLETSSSEYSQFNDTPKSSYTYDPVGRAIEAENPDRTLSKAVYGACVTTTYNINYDKSSEKYNHKKVYTDAWGRTEKIEEYDNDQLYATTTYEYDAQDNLTKVTDAQGNITQIFYDSLGRKTKMLDPDMGEWSYKYDAVGNLVEQTDAKGQKIEFSYDELNRLKTKTYQQTVLCVYEYDDPNLPNSKGRLCKVTYYNTDHTSGGSTEFFYDELGREVQTKKTVLGTGTFTVARTYDSMDRLVNLTYPDGETITYSYNESGALETVKRLSSQGTVSYINNIDYTETGQIAKIEYANNTTTSYKYDLNTRQLQELKTLNPQTALQHFNYAYDPVGNVTNITDSVNTATQAFSYDSLNRLTNATGASYGSIDFKYDTIGNMTQKGNMTLGYGVGAGPHAVTSVSGPDASYAIDYDANGNMLKKQEKEFFYDEQNRLTKVKNNFYHKIISIDLKPGWNFVSFCVLPQDKTVKNVLSSIEGKYSQVAKYNPQIKDFQHYLPDNAKYSKFTEFKYQEGYEIYITGLETVTLTIEGDLPQNSSKDLPKGWHLLAAVKSEEIPVVEAFQPMQLGVDYSKVLLFDKEKNKYLEYSLEKKEFETVLPGVSYLVCMIQNSIWTINAPPLPETEFVYDGDGGRVQKIVGATTTTYIGSLYEVTKGKVTKHIYAGNNRIAMVEDSQTYFYHTDHLGSSNVITDAIGNRASLTEYKPYGETSVQDGTYDSNYKFTGKEYDCTTGLYYYGARYYDPELGRFTQADTIVPNPGDPQDLNRYSYCSNNPINYTDPTGHSAWDKMKKWIGHAVGAVFAVAATIASGNILIGMEVYSFWSGLINSAISGDMAGFGAGFAASCAMSAFMPGINNAVFGATKAFGITDKFAQGFIVGAVEGGIGGFASGFTSEYARTGSSRAALRGAAWGAAIGAPVSGAIVGSYNAGWQGKIHGWKDGGAGENSNNVSFNKVEGDVYGANLSVKGEGSYTAVEYSCETTITETKISLDEVSLTGKVGLGGDGTTGVYGDASFKVISTSNHIKLIKVGDTQFSLHYDLGYGVGVKGGAYADKTGGKVGAGAYAGPGGSFEIRFKKVE